MKNNKIANFFLGILPLLIGLIVQILASIAGMMIYFLINKDKVDALIDQIGYMNAITESSMNFVQEYAIHLSFTCAAIMFIICFIWYRMLCKGESKASLREVFQGKRIIGIVVLAIGFQIAVNVVMSLFMNIVPEFFEEYEMMMELLENDNSLILSFFYAAIFGPISEEYFFRGVVQKHFKRAVPVVAAVFLQALLFGIYHMNWVQGIYAFFVGIVMGYIMERTKSIAATIVFHISFNFSSYLLSWIITDELAVLPIVNIIFVVVGIGSLVTGGWILEKSFRKQHYE